MQITRAATGAGLPHGIGHSNSWKDFTISDYPGTIHRGKYIYYRFSSKNHLSHSFEERKTKVLNTKNQAKKFRKLMQSIQISNVKRG
ncbi:hypothetical protein FACHB389_34525 [Nostoc calcicola FACHB-389]|nr:hypothetical protein [Nostoc calcicola FACHB-3891]OKH17556.1 hypothetical protein FACHB389_34525 [Nostoc calcicola FACHB-389]